MTDHQRWTQTDLTELRRLLEAGKSIAETAESMQRPPELVAAMMSRLRLKVRK